MAAKKKTKKKTRKKSSARKRLTPRKEARGLAPEEAPLSLDAPEVAGLVEEVRAAGGAALGAYREPLSGRPMLFASLPLRAVEPTPFQRNLSPTHTKRLAEKIEETGSFLDPLIVVRGADGRLWTPNGRHRLAAAKVLGLRNGWKKHWSRPERRGPCVFGGRTRERCDRQSACQHRLGQVLGQT